MSHTLHVGRTQRLFHSPAENATFGDGTTSGQRASAAHVGAWTLRVEVERRDRQAGEVENNGVPGCAFHVECLAADRGAVLKRVAV